MNRWRTFDDTFLNAVAPLYVPEMGTDVVAHLLATLVRMHRPRHVLEVGMGYTTPFLAATLAELAAASGAESIALAEKTRRYTESGRALDEAWLAADPPLLRPGFYATPYRPWFVAMDNLSIPESSAERVGAVLANLGLTEHVTIVNADLRECAERLPDGFAPIDLAWVDAWDCLYFFEHCWELINPDGGLLAMHYLMTYPEGEAILRYLNRFQRTHPGELEVMNLLEPHKLMQNSVTVLRRTAASAPVQWADTGGRMRSDPTLRADAARLVATVPAAT